MQANLDVPFTKLQMHSYQNENASNYSEEKYTKYFKKTVRSLGVRN